MKKNQFFIKVINFRVNNLLKMKVNGSVLRKKNCNVKLYMDEGITTILNEETKRNYLPPKNLRRKIISKKVKRKLMAMIRQKY